MSCVCYLNVVVEAEMPVSVLLEQVRCVGVAEVLELDQARGPPQLHGVHEFLDHVVVVLTAHTHTSSRSTMRPSRRAIVCVQTVLIGDVPSQPVVLSAEVERVIEELLVVGAHVEGDGERARRVNTARGHVQRQLTDLLVSIAVMTQRSAIGRP